MNILFPYLARWRSANWSRYHQLLGALCRQGHQVHILEAPPRPNSRETNYADVAVPLPAGMTVHEIPVPLWNASLPLEKLAKKGMLTLATRRFVHQMIRQQQIDVLLLYNFPQIILAGAARGECKVIFDVADDLLAMFEVEVGRWRPLFYPLAKWAFNRLACASHLVTTSSLTLAPKLPGRVRIVPNGVDLSITRRADGRSIRSNYTGPIVGFVGAFEYFVDLSLVMELAERQPGITFLLVGAGRDWERVKGEVGMRGLSNVVLTGAIPYPRNLDYIQAMDICLIPFASGPIGDYAAPLKLFEYLALQKPVVATPLKETQALAGDVISIARDAQEMAAAIEGILSQPSSYQEHTRQGLERVTRLYDWDYIAQSFVDALQDR